MGGFSAGCSGVWPGHLVSNLPSEVSPTARLAMGRQRPLQEREYIPSESDRQTMGEQYQRVGEGMELFDVKDTLPKRFCYPSFNCFCSLFQLLPSPVPLPLSDFDVYFGRQNGPGLCCLPGMKYE